MVTKHFHNLNFSKLLNVTHNKFEPSKKHHTLHKILFLINDYLKRNSKDFKDNLKMVDLKSEIESRIIDKVVWSFEENSIKMQMKKWNKSSSSTDKILEHQMRKSMLGHFLYEFNCVQQQEEEIQIEKIYMYKNDCASKINSSINARVNNLTDNIDGVLLDTVKTSEYGNGIVTKRNILQKLKILRISSSNMPTFQSNRIEKLKNLEFLVLPGNGIITIKGKNIPRNVKFLELYMNRLSDMTELTDQIPTQLVYLGLNRNLLKDDVQISNLESLKNIIVLDLGENNIVDLNYVLQLLTKSTPNLSALTLQGNPCSYLPQYFTETVTQLTKLEKLDNVDVKDYIPFIGNEISKPEMIINCYRIMGIAQSQSETFEKKKVTKTFHIELECPLMDEGLRNWEEIRLKRKYEGLPEEEEIEIVETPTDKKAESKNKPSSETKESEKHIKPPSSKKDKRENEPDLDEEVLQEILKNDKRLPGASEIVSERMSWEKMIVFKEPTIQLFPPDGNLILLRDAFRSQIILRVILLKVVPSGNTGGKSKPATAGARGKTSPNGNTQENVISREVVAKIPINLKSMKWNTEAVFYSWDKKTPYVATEASNLKTLNYNLASKKGTPNTKGSKNTADKNVNAPLTMPNFITCHISVGVKRDPLNKIEPPI